MIYPLASRLRTIYDTADRTPGRQVQVIHKTGIADNTPTALFTVATANETGSTDGGAYLCTITALIAHAATSATTSAAAKAFAARFTRAMLAAGAGALSSVTEDHDDTPADTDAATRSIGNVTLTLAETSEYLITASITVDLTGADVQTAEVIARVEILATGFLTPPRINPA